MYESEFWYSIYCCIISTCLFPFLVYIKQIYSDQNNLWWTNIKAFQPSLLNNLLTTFSYVTCVCFSKIFTRYLLDKPLYYGGAVRLYDIIIVIPLLVSLEFISYIIHRLQHIDGLYQISHIHHHQVKYVNIWSSFYAHPLDYLSTAIPMTLFLSYLSQYHWITDAIITIVSSYSLVIIHSEYKSISNGHHNMHHLNPLCNYSGMNPYIDRLFGTYVNPKTFK